MKIYKIMAALLMGAVAVACNGKPAAEASEDGEVAEEITFTRGEIDSVSYLVGVNFGGFLKGYDFGKLNKSEIMKGVNDQLNAKGNPRDTNFAKQFKVSPELINELFNSYLEKRHQLKVQENKAKEAKFLAEYETREGVQKTEDGILYLILSQGDDVRASLSDTVWVNYKGTLMNGDVFDETPEGAEPVRMLLSRVIPGWQKTIPMIGQGGEMTIVVPSSLAYGEYGNNGIEPCSPLQFNIKLDKVGKFVAK